MKIPKSFYAADRKQWRAWLEKNHKTQTEVWLIYYKKASKRPRIPYDDAVEEALCFGWVDSLVKRIDDEKYAQKFTPRKDTSKWSEPNKKRLRAMMEQGKMTGAGLAVIDKAVLTRLKDREGKSGKPNSGDGVPVFVQAAIDADKRARRNFYSLTPSHRLRYIRWIMSAKREETQKDRLKQAISMLAQGKAAGDVIPGFVQQALDANQKARANFENLAPSDRRTYIRWIITARKEETSKNRLAEAIRLLEQNKKLGLK